MSKKLRDELVAKAVGGKIQKEMEMISRTFNNVVGNYSFLFDGDTLATQAMLIEACFPKDEEIITEVKNEEVIHFNVETIVQRIPEEMKEALYAKMLDQFATQININDLKPDKEG